MDAVVGTYTVLVHEGEDVIRPEHHGYQPGWIRVEEEVPHMGLREVVRTMRGEGYADEAILVQSECATSSPLRVSAANPNRVKAMVR